MPPKREPRVERALRSSKYEPLILKPGDIEFVKTVTLRPPFRDVWIDETYQRVEIKAKVNELIRVLDAGGLITELDPVKIVLRDDGSKWIVEGQQRFWAHYHCGKPMQAMAFRTKTSEAERAFFLIANDKRPVAAVTKVKAWPAEAGNMIRWMNEDRNSGLRTEIDFLKSSARIPASTIANSYCCALYGTANTSRIEDTMRRIRSSILTNPSRAQKTAKMFSVLISQVFNDGRKVYQNPPRALGLACYEHWKDKPATGPWPSPSKSQLRRIKAIRWADLFPDRRSQWVPYMRDEILKRWPVVE